MVAWDASPSSNSSVDGSVVRARFLQSHTEASLAADPALSDGEVLGYYFFARGTGGSPLLADVLLHAV